MSVRWGNVHELVEVVDRELMQLEADWFFESEQVEWATRLLVGQSRDAFFDKIAGDVLRYYKWIVALGRVVRPRVVVEFGTGDGRSAIAFCLGCEDTMVYTVDVDSWAGLRIPPEWVGKRVVRRVCQSVEREKVLRGIDVEEVDVWFFDSLHEAWYLEREIRTYAGDMRAGAVVLVGDVDWFGLGRVWKKVKASKVNRPDLHKSGFGVFLVPEDGRIL